LKLPLLGGHPPLGLRSTGALTALGPAEKAALKEIPLTCLAITWLKPHVYLDKVFLIGAISTQFPGFGASFAAARCRLVDARIGHSLRHVVDLVPARRRCLMR
jgi:hypothetical protein